MTAPVHAQSYDLDAEAIEGRPGIEFNEAELRITNNDSTYWYRVVVSGLAVNDGPISKDDCETRTDDVGGQPQCAGLLDCEIWLSAVLTIAPSATAGISGVMPIVDDSGDADTCHEGCSHCDNEEGITEFCVDFNGTQAAEITQVSFNGSDWTRLTNPVVLSFTVTNLCE